MSAVEQLKDNVAGILEDAGVLARIRAELRAEVFAAIEMQKPPSANNIPLKIAEFVRGDFGQHAIDVVVEFLEFFRLKHTLSVFRAETHRPEVTGVNRDALWNALLSAPSDDSTNKPLLVSILQQKIKKVGREDDRIENDPFSARDGSEASRPISLPTVQPYLPLTASNSAKPDAIHSQRDTEFQPRDRCDPEPRESVPRISDPVASLTAKASAPGAAGFAKPDAANAKTVVECIEQRSKISGDKNAPGAGTAEPFLTADVQLHAEPVRRASATTKPGSLPLQVSASPTVFEPKDDGYNPVDQLHKIDGLLKQLDTKQMLTDQAKAKFDSDPHLPREELSDGDDIDFDDDDFKYEPDDVVKDDGVDLFPGFSAKPASTARGSASVECFSDDPSADEHALDSFDVVRDARPLSRRAI